MISDLPITSWAYDAEARDMVVDLDGMAGALIKCMQTTIYVDTTITCFLSVLSVLWKQPSGSLFLALFIHPKA